MMRTFLTALTLVGLVACGNKRPEPGARHSTAARSTARAPAKSSTTSRNKSKTRARVDTTTSKNPLTNR